METNIEQGNDNKVTTKKKKTLFKDWSAEKRQEEILLNQKLKKETEERMNTPEEKEALARYRATKERQAGIFGKLALFFGFKDEKDLKKIQPYLQEINRLYEDYQNLSSDQLRQKTQDLKNYIQEKLKKHKEVLSKAEKRLEENTSVNPITIDNLYRDIKVAKDNIYKVLENVLDEILPQAFAILKETTRRFAEYDEIVVTATDFDRKLSYKKDYVTIDEDDAIWVNHWNVLGHDITWNMVYYDVQLIGGIILHQGKIAEMATGEGKTLVVTLPVFLNALAGEGVHVVTVNDYLAKRDCHWMTPIFEFHGLSIACIDETKPNSKKRREAYAADITYGTNNEFGFDYLRDNMATTIDEVAQRNHHFAIVDEVDSILIDDARTPLIISGPTNNDNSQSFIDYKPYVKNIYEAQCKIVNKFLLKAKELLPKDPKNEEGQKALFRAYRGLPKYRPLIKFLSEPGIKSILEKVEDYYMEDNCRLMPEADAELFFAIEELTNSVELTDKGFEYISNLQEDKNFFVMPDIAIAIANIENDANLNDVEKTLKKNELIDEFSLKAERLHVVKQLLKAYALFNKDIDYVVMNEKVLIVDEQTGRILDGRRFSDGLHQALEAKENVKIEKPTQTSATITLQNYFRLYHKLSGMTGTASTEANEFYDTYKLDVVAVPTNKTVLRDDKTDMVFKTARAKFDAVIEQIVQLSKSGRPVLVGTTSVDISELLSRMLTLKKIKHQVLNAKYHQQEAEIVSHAGESGTVTIATNMAGRGTDIKLTPESRAAGGLAIIGTERHESRRVDRQLRGRAGRQGDVGSSQFFVSFEDNLMRLGMNDTIHRFVDKLDENEVIQSKMVAKAIERAQKKVEQNNYGFRKRLLEYDDVLNKQRDIIYKRRKVSLEKKNVYTSSLNLLYFVAKNSIVKIDEKNEICSYDDAAKIFHQITNTEIPIERKKFTSHNAEKSTIKVYEKFVDMYKAKCDTLDVILKDKFGFLFEENSNYEDDDEYTFSFIKDEENIYVDVNVGELRKNLGKELMRVLESTITIFFIDKEWQNHLQVMDDLKHSVQHAHYEQKDPLLVYKLEAFSVFMEMVIRLNCEIVEFLLKSDLYVKEQRSDDDEQNLVLDSEDFSLDMLEKIRQKLGTHIG